MFQIIPIDQVLAPVGHVRAGLEPGSRRGCSNCAAALRADGLSQHLTRGSGCAAHDRHDRANKLQPAFGLRLTSPSWST